MGDRYISFYIKDPKASAKLREIADKLGVSTSSLVSQIMRQILSAIEGVETEDSLAYLHLRYVSPFLVINTKEGRRIEKRER